MEEKQGEMGAHHDYNLFHVAFVIVVLNWFEG